MIIWGQPALGCPSSEARPALLAPFHRFEVHCREGGGFNRAGNLLNKSIAALSAD
jgi:hypothetical protein